MNQIPVQLSSFHQVLDFRNRHLRGRRHHGIKIPRRLAVHQIPYPVPLPRPYKREVRLQPALHQVSPALELTRLLSFCHNRADSRRRKKRRNSRTPRANPLGKCPLRHQIEFDLSRQHHRFQQLVLAHVSTNVASKLPRRQQ
jgi:hypothetical protein